MIEHTSSPRSVDWHLVAESAAAHPTNAEETGPTGIMSVLTAADELARCQTLDTLLRRAVELARHCIGLERVGLYLQDEAGEFMHGTWGTGPDGELTDERAVRYAYGDIDREAHRRVEAGVGRWLQLRDAPLIAHGDGTTTVLGTGWLILTPVRSLRAPVGILYNDTAITRAPVDAAKQVRTAVFASLLGNLIEASREPTSLSRSLPPTGAKYGALVRKAIAALSEDPTVTADKLASRLTVSPARLARAFRAELGVSLVQYRNRLRLERFFGLVEHRGGNFSEAAHTAGFGSYAQFHRIFRQHVGVTPREYLTGSRHSA